MIAKKKAVKKVEKKVVKKKATFKSTPPFVLFGRTFNPSW